MITLKDISPENIPINAGPNDQFIGENDGGGSVYRGIDGNEYTLYPETTTKRPSYTKVAGETLKEFGDWFTTPQSVSGINSDVGNFLLDAGKAVAKGVYEPIERLMTGKGTVGDVTTTASNVGLSSAPNLLGGAADKDTLSAFFSPRYKRKPAGPTDPFEQVPFDPLDTATAYDTPLYDLVDSITFPKDGLKGSQFIKEINDSPSIRNSEWDNLGIEINPAKRYSKTELEDLITSKRHATFGDEIGAGYESYQRQDDLLDQEQSYHEFVIKHNPLSPNTPTFAPHAGTGHFGKDVLAHSRYSVRKDATTGDNYLLVEELQSDLLQKGFKKAQKGERSKYNSLGEALDDYYKAEHINSWRPEQFFGEGVSKELLYDYADLAYRRRWGTNDPLSREELNRFREKRDTLYDLSKEFVREWYIKTYKQEPDDSELHDLVSENFNSFNDDIIRIGETELKDTLAVASPPVKKTSESVRLLMDGLIAQADQKGLTKIVIPPLEKIVEKRFKHSAEETAKALSPKSGFYDTYITSVNKYLKELKDEFGDDVQITQKDMAYKGTGNAQTVDDLLFEYSPTFRYPNLYGVQDILIRWATEGRSLGPDHYGFIEFLDRKGFELDPILSAASDPNTFDLAFEIAKQMKPAPSSAPVVGIEIDFSGVKNQNYDLQRPKFAEGGAVEQDPISGNTIPPGSTANEVRDNVDAKLSEGEYVLPADVVKYFGLDYIEKLIGKAKKGMEELHAGGRIGGQGPDDLPFSPEELQAHETEMSSETTPAPVQMAEGGLVPSEWQITDDNTVDPITGLPLWMKKPVNKSVQNKMATRWQDFGMNNGGRQNDYKPQTGLAGSVDQWGPDDFLNYAKNKDSLINKGLETAIGAVVPFGGLLTKARHNYLDKNVPPQLDAMIESGVDRQGNPLSALQIASLKEARANLANGSSDTGIGNTLKRSFDGLFHKGVSPVKASSMAGPSGKSQSSTQSIKSSSSKGNPNGNDSNMTKHLQNRGFVTRRKTP